MVRSVYPCLGIGSGLVYDCCFYGLPLDQWIRGIEICFEENFSLHLNSTVIVYLIYGYCQHPHIYWLTCSEIGWSSCSWRMVMVDYSLTLFVLMFARYCVSRSGCVAPRLVLELLLGSVLDVIL